jgi:hypothetical protein
MGMVAVIRVGQVYHPGIVLNDLAMLAQTDLFMILG